MHRQPVDSSNLRSVGYDAATKTLEVEFRSGAVYQYSGVDEETFNRFMASPSKGKFLYRSVRAVHTGRRA